VSDLPKPLASAGRQRISPRQAASDAAPLRASRQHFQLVARRKLTAGGAKRVASMPELLQVTGLQVTGFQVTGLQVTARLSSFSTA